MPISKKTKPTSLRERLLTSWLQLYPIHMWRRMSSASSFSYIFNYSFDPVKEMNGIYLSYLKEAQRKCDRYLVKPATNSKKPDVLICYCIFYNGHPPS